MKRCVIVSAGQIQEFEKAKALLSSDDYFIFCDGGLAYAEKLGVMPDVIVGDFDSCDPELLEKYSSPGGGAGASCQIIRLPREKDDTDTFYAVKLALERGFDDFLLLGSMGARFDHTLGNVSILLYLYKKGKSAMLADDYSKMRIAGAKPVMVPDTCAYFSVLTIAGNVSGVTIKNAKYPLENASLSSDFQLGISNEVLPGCVAEVSVKEGVVLLVEILK